MGMDNATDDPEICAGCVFFRQHQVFDATVRATVNKPFGDCRHESPRVRVLRSSGGSPADSLSAVWPVVAKQDWCGAFQTRLDRQEGAA